MSGEENGMTDRERSATSDALDEQLHEIMDRVEPTPALARFGDFCAGMRASRERLR